MFPGMLRWCLVMWWQLCPQDAIRFDAFLKENDRMAHEALKNAEREAKAKTDKLHEIKRLKHSISVVEGKKSKLKEELEDCERYRRVRGLLLPAVPRAARSHRCCCCC